MSNTQSEATTSTDSTNSSTSEKLSLEFLIKLMPDSFDGDRFKLRSFIKQIDSVFELAQPSQLQPLLLYVKSKIIGKAREQVDIHCNLTTWTEISELLIRLYQDKKSLDQLLEELIQMNQTANENVSQFYQRLEDLSSRILGIIHATETDPSKLSGRLVMIQDMTLNRFIYHTHPQISQMLRYRSFDNINNALTAASAEEKALRLAYKTNISKCKICGRNNHTTNNCYKNKNKQMPISKNIHYNQSNTNRQDQTPKQCKYCKNFGHTINECRKREYNNSRKNNSPTQSNATKPQSINFTEQNFREADRIPETPPNQIEQVTQAFANWHA